MNPSLATASPEEASALSASTLYQQEHDLNAQGQYTYSSAPICYASDVQVTVSAGVANPVYNSYGDLNVAPLDATGLQNVNVEAFTAYA